MKWPVEMLPFEDALEDQTPGQVKIQRSDYLVEGKLPIIDQGQKPIAGFTDNLALAYQGPSPVLLFGDHTLLTKHVDFPFALGADGVRVLTAKPWFIAKFLYYYLQAKPIQSRGYSRHFKFLREMSFPHIARSEQRKILELLEQADGLRQQRSEADTLADRTLPALFHSIFGDPATNPKGWAATTLDQATEITTGNTPSREDPANFGGDIPWGRPADLETALPLLRTAENISEKGALVARIVPSGSVLVCCIGATLGKVGLAGVEMAINQQINALLPTSKATQSFLYTFCLLNARRFMAAATQATLPILNKSRFGQQPVLLPPLDRQRRFSEGAQRVMKLLPAQRQAREDLENLFTTMLHRAFTGQLTVKWREAHIKELLAEMEHHARLPKSPPQELAFG